MMCLLGPPDVFGALILIFSSSGRHMVWPSKGSVQLPISIQHSFAFGEAPKALAGQVAVGSVLLPLAGVLKAFVDASPDDRISETLAAMIFNVFLHLKSWARDRGRPVKDCSGIIIKHTTMLKRVTVRLQKRNLQT